MCHKKKTVQKQLKLKIKPRKNKIDLDNLQKDHRIYKKTSW